MWIREYVSDTGIPYPHSSPSLILLLFSFSLLPFFFVFSFSFSFSSFPFLFTYVLQIIGGRSPPAPPVAPPLRVTHYDLGGCNFHFSNNRKSIFFFFGFFFGGGGFCPCILAKLEKCAAVKLWNKISHPKFTIMILPRGWGTPYPRFWSHMAFEK